MVFEKSKETGLKEKVIKYANNDKIKEANRK